MAKITELPVLADANVDGTERVPVVQGGAMRQASVAGLGKAAATAAQGFAADAASHAGALQGAVHARTGGNLFNPAAVIAGKYVNTASGAIQSDPNWSTSGLIPVTPGKDYSIWANADFPSGVAFYADAGGTYVAGSVSAATPRVRTVTAPAGAAFMRFNVRSAALAMPAQIMVSTGAQAQEWEPFAGGYEVGAAQIDRGALVNAAGRNLLDPAQVRVGFYISNGAGAEGSIQVGAGWKVSGFIPVVAGEAYTVSGGRTNSGISFFSEPRDNAHLGKTGLFYDQLERTVIAPIGAKFMVIDLQTAASGAWANVQVERGTVATAYAPFARDVRVSRDRLWPLTDVGATATISPDSAAGTTVIVRPVGNRVLRSTVTPFAAASHAASRVFNLSAEFIGGNQLRFPADDVSPYWVDNWVIGGNHGHAKSDLAVAAHGKTAADVGSVWTDGANQWVMVDLPDANTISMVRRGTSQAYMAGTPALTHVSGAAHPAGFAPTAVVQAQWFPAIRDRDLAIYVDRNKLGGRVGDLTFSDQLVFAESYSIMRKDALTEWLITRVGTATDITDYAAAPALSVSLRHAFDREGGYTLFNEAVALEAMPLTYFAFLQGIAPAQDPALRRLYVPKTVPFVADGVARDLRSPVRLDALPAWTDLTTDRADGAYLPPDRLVWTNPTQGWGLAMGYLPVLDCAPGVRAKRIPNRSIQLSPTLKAYFFAVDGQAALAAGEAHSAVGYKVFFPLTAARTACYPVRSELGNFLYIDWHATTRDRVPLPADFQGRAFEVVEKSANVTLRSGAAAGGSLLFDVDCSATPAGFAVLKFAPTAIGAPVVQDIASAAVVTPEFGNDQVNVTAQATGLTLANPVGAPVKAWGMTIRIRDNGLPRAIAYGSQYRPIGVALPAATVAGKTLYLGMIYNSADAKWDVMSVAQEA